MCAAQVSMNGGVPALSGRTWSTVRDVQRSLRCWKSQRASEGQWLCDGAHSLSCWRSEVNTDRVGLPLSHSLCVHTGFCVFMLVCAGWRVPQCAAAAARGALLGTFRLHVHPAGGGRRSAEPQPRTPTRTCQLHSALVHIPVESTSFKPWYMDCVGLIVTGDWVLCCRRFSSGTREKVLRWLFPKAELCPLLDSAGTIVQRCLVTHSTNSQSKVSSLVQTSSHWQVRGPNGKRCCCLCRLVESWLGAVMCSY